MGGYVEGQLIGTAPDAKYYLFVTEDVLTENPVEESNWVEAAEEADKVGVDIITTSLGYFAFDNPAYSHVYSDLTGNSAFASKGANIAFSKGIFVVASAGNEGATTDNHIGVPSEALNVLAVGAVDASRNYASFSSIGPSFDNRVKPDVMAQGSPAFYSNTSGNIVSGNGTSFSCPIMAGMVACLWQAYPSKTNIEIKKLIIESADRFTNPTAQYGYGIPDFSQALTMGNLSVATFSKTDIIIYPNPSSDIISFNFPLDFEKGTICIYTLLGQKVLEQNITNQMPRLSIKSLSNGLYLYKIESEGFSKSGKLVKK
jgi:subtilisin family serine protease